MRAVLNVGLLGLAALTLAGCGEGYRDRNAFTISLTDTGLFAPSTLRIPLNASVTFYNAGTQPREVLYEPNDVRTAQTRPPGAPKLTPNTAQPADAAPWRSGTLYPGESWTYTFAQSGAYLFQSPYANGFIGTPSTAGGAYMGAEGQPELLVSQPPFQVAAGVITVEGVEAGARGDDASSPQTNPSFPTPAAPPGGDE